MPESDDLTHWGVKGMRWGVRNSETPVASPSLGHIRRSQALRVGATVAAAIVRSNAKTILKKTPRALVKGAVVATKTSISLARNTRRMASGAKLAVRILGATGRGTTAYARGVVKVARALR